MDKRADGKWVPGGPLDEDGHPIRTALMIVAESPGRQEERHKPPKVLVGPTGKESDNLLLRIVGVPRERVYCTNICKHVGDVDMELMGEVLRDEISEVRPKVILALGAIAVRWFLGDVDMEAVNAIPHQWQGITLIPSFHPAAIFRDTTRMSWVLEAFGVAKRSLRQQCVWWKVLPSKYRPLEQVYLSSPVAVDTESLKDGTPFMLTACSITGIAGYAFCEKGIPVDFKEYLARKDVLTILHNALYDIPVLKAMGITLGNWTDTMLMASALQTLPLGLKSLAFKLCGMKLKTYDEVVKDGDLDEIPPQRAIKYACGDADATLRVYHRMLPMVKEWGIGGCLSTDMAVMPMVIDMMQNGIKLDSGYIAEVEEEFTIRNICTAQEIEDIAGRKINPASAKQVSELLYKELKLGKGTRIKRTKWGGTTEQKTLERIQGEHKIVPLILDWKQLDTLIDKYLSVLPRKMDADGRIHTKLSLARIPHSGRLASSNPNLLAQPVRTEDGQRIRDGFVAEKGWELVSFDYNQIEMRIMAHESQDPVMMKAYREGRDIHTETAKEIFGVQEPDEMKQRRPAKIINFGVIYGLTAMGLSRELMANGLSECTEAWCDKFIIQWFQLRKGVKKYIERVKTETRRKGYVTDMWGRRVLIPEVKSFFPWIREAGLRRATNQPIQGGAQGVIKKAMKWLGPEILDWRTLGHRIKPLLQIHDDLLFEIKDEDREALVPIIKSGMEGAGHGISVPTPVNVKRGKRWGSLSKYT